MPLYASGEPNFAVRYSSRLMPSRGTQELRKNGRQFSSTGTSEASASASSMGFLPMEHQGQTTSETISIFSGLTEPMGSSSGVVLRKTSSKDKPIGTRN